MCGIVGYVGEGQALPVLLDGLRRLEYRGYDSAGLAVQGIGGMVAMIKRSGRVEVLAQAVAAGNGSFSAARTGIAHTRWATHGCPSEENAHPHADEAAAVALVHNGIIENHEALRAELAARGHAFRSQTDSEVVAHLIEEALTDTVGMDPVGRLRAAVTACCARLRGSYALAVLWEGAPGVIVGTRHQTPLIIGWAGRAMLLASDVAALLPQTREVLPLQDGDVVVLRTDGAMFYAADGGPIPARQPTRVDWDQPAAERGGFAHFMLKEIHEQPQALAEALRGRLGPDGPALPELGDASAAAMIAANRAVLVACGTAYHAALVGRRLFERCATLPAEADIASEFRYRDPFVGAGDLAIAVSQSGETADTLAALREASARGAHALAVVNVVDSAIARAARVALYTQAGPEIAVASTKAYTTQIAVLALAAVQAGRLRGTLDAAALEAWGRDLARLPAWAEMALALEPQVADLARGLATASHCFFLGRGLDWATAMEGQLKLKEVSYLHAEAYAAGELKHGTLALIETGTPVVALFTQPELVAKTASNVAEVKARGARVLGVATGGLSGLVTPLCDDLIVLPDVPALLAPVIAAIPLQLLAYHTAVARGTDVDKPRNLAKSVTVE